MKNFCIIIFICFISVLHAIEYGDEIPATYLKAEIVYYRDGRMQIVTEHHIYEIQPLIHSKVCPCGNQKDSPCENHQNYLQKMPEELDLSWWPKLPKEEL